MNFFIKNEFLLKLKQQIEEKRDDGFVLSHIQLHPAEAAMFIERRKSRS